MAYDEYGAQGANGTAAQARTYLTYAEGAFHNLKAVNDCGGSNACYSVVYFQPSFVFLNGSCSSVFAQEFFAAASEGWFLHWSGFTDAGHRLTGYRKFTCGTVQTRQPVYALNQSNTGVQSFVRTYLRTNADQFDYILMDSTSAHNLTQFYGTGGGMCRNFAFPYLCPSTQEYPNDAALVEAHHQFFSSLTHTNGSPMKLFFNGVTVSANQPTDLVILSGNSNMYAAACEDCVVSLGKYRPDNYPSVLNTMAKIDAIPNGSYIELNIANDPAGSPAQIGERTISTAMAWLGYSPGHVIVFPDFEYGSKNFPIWPEDNIVPTNPVESMTSSYTDIQVAPSVYRREFGACYNFGKPIGQCAAIVNGNSTTSITVSPSWLRLHYGHVIELSGGDIPSGGQMLLNAVPFVPSAATLAPGHGILLVR